MRRAAALCALALFSCRPAAREPASSAPKAESPDQIISRFTIDSFSSGGREWVLTADKANMFDKDQRTEVEAPFIQFYDGGRPGSTLRAGRGRLHTATKDLRAWDGVVIVSTDGARLESPWMDYFKARDIIVSSAPVTVTRGGTVARGVGWEARPDLSKLVLHRQTVEIVEEGR